MGAFNKGMCYTGVVLEVSHIPLLVYGLHLFKTVPGATGAVFELSFLI
jgi:hypothetical protein